MIGFNSAGRTKVWLNENFGKNLPDYDLQTFQRRRQQNQALAEANMINSIYEIVQGHNEEGRFPESFRNAFTGTNLTNFTDAVNFVRNYAASNGIQLPDRISLGGIQSVTTTTVVETTPVDVTSSLPATVTTSVTPLQYTFNPVIQQTPSVILQPQVITSTQSIPSPVTSSVMIPNAVRTVPTVQMVQSVSTPPAQLLQTVGGTGNFISRNVLPNVQTVNQSVLSSQGPTINILPSSTIKTAVQQMPVQTSMFEGRKVLKLP